MQETNHLIPNYSKRENLQRRIQREGDLIILKWHNSGVYTWQLRTGKAF